ncbi:MAG: CBS domain-containing protein [Acidiferrobacterales bacterium]|nr:CBS domain-containing protein [Acidiferrobacterales bacterium]
MTTIGSLLDARSGEAIIHQIKPNQTVREALELMKEKDIGCVLVMENNHLMGILSERDYARKMILTGKASHNTPVAEIMTADVICTSRQNSVDECMDLMSKCDFRHLPVVENEHVLGMVSIRDLVASVIREQKDTIEHLQHYITS